MDKYENHREEWREEDRQRQMGIDPDAPGGETAVEASQAIKVTIYQCQMHKPDYTFAVVDEPWPAGSFPACPICQSEDHIYMHAIGELTETQILNQEEA